MAGGLAWSKSNASNPLRSTSQMCPVTQQTSGSRRDLASEKQIQHQAHKHARRILVRGGVVVIVLPIAARLPWIWPSFKGLAGVRAQPLAAIKLAAAVITAAAAGLAALTFGGEGRAL